MAEETPSINIAEHDFVPKHELMKEEDVEKVLVEYGIVKRNFPKIQKNDPAIKAQKLVPGDVVKITRNSLTAGVATYYRVVI